MGTQRSGEERLQLEGVEVNRGVQVFMIKIPCMKFSKYSLQCYEVFQVFRGTMEMIIWSMSVNSPFI